MSRVGSVASVWRRFGSGVLLVSYITLAQQAPRAYSQITPSQDSFDVVV